MTKKIIICLLALMPLLASAQEILIFGGDNHDVFLGYLNASPYSSNSIWNEYGNYGNEYNSNCIWNKYGTYGNEYSSYSPWNEYSSNVPVLVDRDGNYYGPFSANNSNEVVRLICKYAEQIMDGDVRLDKWYEFFFE